MYYGSSVTTNGVTFTSNIASVFAIGRDYVSGAFLFGSANVVLVCNNHTSNLTAVLPAGTHAFGVDLGARDFQTGTAKVTVSTGDSFNVDVAHQPGLHFVGFASDQEISSITFSGISFDDVDLAFADYRLASDVVSVPEPASLTLCGIGTVGLCIYGWRRRKLNLP